MATFTGTGNADVANANSGQLTGFTGGTVEELQDGAGDNIDGLAGNDTIVAGAGDDTITGGQDVDAVSAGAGNDVLAVENDHLNPGETYDGGDGFDTLRVTSNVGFFTNSFQNSTVTSIEAIELLGTHQIVRFDAGQLPTSLAVTGNPSANDQIRVALNTPGEIDVSGWTFSNWTPGNDFIHLEGSSGADILTGSSQRDQILAGPGNDILNGGLHDDILHGDAGNDVMRGGAGSDLYFVDSSGDQVIETASEGLSDQVISLITYSLPANVEQLILGGSNPINGTGNSLNNGITGTDAANTLNGGAGNDSLEGLGGNDRLIGGAGNDFMQGGLGNDLYEVDSTGDALTENSGEGHDTVRSTVNWTLLNTNFEDLFLTGTAATNGTGNIQHNRIEGNAAANTLSGLEGNDLLSGAGGNDTLNGGLGDDRLIGGAGNDSMTGGAGNDLYEIDAADAPIVENSNEGTDTVRSPISYTLGPPLENLFLTGTAATNGIGNELNNIIVGNSGGNSLGGFDGNDVLLGGAGNDGLTGNNGNDQLDGGAGADFLSGGSGNDIFFYAFPTEGIDLISDFNIAEDTFVISAAGFGSGLSPGEELVLGKTFVVTTSHPHTASTTLEGTFLYVVAFESLWWDADGFSPGAAVHIASFFDPTPLTTADFLIV